MEPPRDWKNLQVNATLRVRGVYVTPMLAGLIIDLEALQYVNVPPEKPAKKRPCPFATPGTIDV